MGRGVPSQPNSKAPATIDLRYSERHGTPLEAQLENSNGI